MKQGRWTGGSGAWRICPGSGLQALWTDWTRDQPRIVLTVQWSPVGEGCRAVQYMTVMVIWLVVCLWCQGAAGRLLPLGDPLGEEGEGSKVQVVYPEGKLHCSLLIGWRGGLGFEGDGWAE